MAVKEKKMVRALTVFKPAKVPMVCVPDRSLLPLYRDFLTICNTGDLRRIQQFHTDSISTHPALFNQHLGPQLVNKPLYSRFMGSIYCNIHQKNESDPVNRWFHGIATEIHRLH